MPSPTWNCEKGGSRGERNERGEIRDLPELVQNEKCQNDEGQEESWLAIRHAVHPVAEDNGGGGLQMLHAFSWAYSEI